MNILTKLCAYFRKNRFSADMTDEMRLHLDLLTQAKVREGLTAPEASYAAQRQFGNVEGLKEIARDQRGLIWLDHLWQDLRYGIRQLRRSPGFSATVIVTLALAIGANTAIFSFFRGILLRPLPYKEPARIVVVKKGAADFGDFLGGDIGLFAADFIDLQRESRTVDKLSTFTAEVATLTGKNEPDLVYGAIVSSEFFAALGSHAAIGRTFSSADLATSSGRPIVISHQLWQNSLGGEMGVIGRTITLNRVVFTVVGVMPADFDFPSTALFWAAPLGAAPENQIGSPVYDTRGRGNAVRSVFGRLKPGVSPQQAEQEIAALVQRLPNPNTAPRVSHLVNMRDQTIGDVRPALGLLLSCVGLVLLIACLNVANLMLSRASTRQREMSIRLALGSGRGRIARQLLTESVLLALIGGVTGVMISAWGLDALVQLAPKEIPRLAAVHVDGWVLGFALGVSMLTGIVCGLAPVFETSKVDLVTTMKIGDRAGSAGGWAQRLRSILVAGEVAISLVLLVAAGLLLHSFWQMRAVSWGFNPTQVVSARVAFMDERYAEDSARLAFYRTLMEKLEAVPGFESVGTSLDRIGQSWVHLPFTPEGHTFVRAEDAPQANVHLLVSPNYFKTLQIPLVQGRMFSATDGEGSQRVVIVDLALARRYFPEGEAIGKRMDLVLFGRTVQAQIIGVVGNVKTDGPTSASLSDFYVPFPQFPWNNFFVHVRTPIGLAAAGATIKRVVSEVDASAPVIELATMEQVIDKPGNARRFPLGLLGGFAGVALLLAAIGIYGVTTYSVAQRTREIGLRMALGAQPRSVLSMILSQSFRPISIGLAAGLIGSVVVAFAMEKMLFGVPPIDVQTFASIPLLMTIVAFFACIVPARRASKVDPMVALRGD